MTILKHLLLFFSLSFITALSISQTDDSYKTDGNSPEERHEIYMEKILYYLLQSLDYDSSLYLIHKGLDEFKNEKYYYSKYLRYKGMYFDRVFEDDSAKIYYSKALVYPIKAHEYQLQAHVYNDFGYFFYARSQFDSATFYFLQAMSANEKSENYLDMAMIQNNIGLIKMHQNDFMVAKEYFKESMLNYKKSDDSTHVTLKRISTCINLANCYNELQNFEQAHYYCDKSIQSSLEYGDTLLCAGSLRLKGEILAEQRQYKGSISYLQLGYNLIKDKQNTLTEFRLLDNLNQSYREMALYDSAIYYGKTGLELSKKSGDSVKIIAFLHELELTYEKKGDYKSAYYHLKKYHELVDHDNHYKEFRTIEEMEHKYRAEHKTHQLNLLKEEAKNERLILSILILVLIFIIVISYVIRIISKNRRELAWSKERNEISAQIVYGAESERNRISRDLHDSVGSGLASLHLLLEQIKRNPNENIDQALKQTKSLGNEVRAISHQLAPYKIEQEGLIFALEDFVSFINTNQKLSVKMQLSDEANALPTALQILVYRIIQELIQNILKHSQASNVQINLEKDDTYFNLILTDNGIGFNPDPNQYGIGLKNIAARLRYARGEMKITSKEGKGVLFDIKIPA